MEKTNSKQIVSYSLIFLIVIVFLGGIILYERGKYFDGKLHVVFCDVGQGDAIFVRTPQGKDILIDGGPDESVLNCLSNFLPFWDRKIDLVLLSHPHQDHFVGLIDVFERFTVRSFATEKLSNDTEGFKTLQQKVEDENISWQTIQAGDRFRISHGININIVGPSSEYLEETSPGGRIGEKQEFASLVIHISYGTFDVLLTGDSQVSGITNALPRIQERSIEVLQVPHHGSKSGIDQSILQLLHPQLSIISVGTKNRYRHPSSETISLLEKYNVLRTDKNGGIEIISDGEVWKTRVLRGEERSL